MPEAGEISDESPDCTTHLIQPIQLIKLIPFHTMTKKIRIPTQLRKLTNNEEIIEVQAASIGEAIAELQSRYPGIRERLVDDNGEVRRFVNLYVNEEDIRFLKNQQTPLKDGDEVSIIPAIAGG
jgi:sulfur-carrier protein